MSHVCELAISVRWHIDDACASRNNNAAAAAAAAAAAKSIGLFRPIVRTNIASYTI